MNNKIFKKKSSFYLFGALAFLLILACVGGFFVFNASAANPDVAQGCVQITNLLPNGIVVRDESGSLISGNSSITVERDKTIKLRLSFDDYHMGDESAFEAVTASDGSGNKMNYIVGNIYEDNNSIKENYNCMITKDPNDPTLFSLNLPNWTVSNSYYYAKVNLSFINRTSINTKKVTLDSIASDYGWVGANEIFGVYEKADENYKKNIKDFFKVPQNSEKLTFYVKPTDTFEDNLGKMSFSATHKATIKENEKEKEITLNYDVDKGNNIVNKEYQEVTLKLFSVDGKGNKNDETGITGDLTLNLTASNITCNKSRTITVNEAKDTSGNTVDLNNSSNVNVKIAVPGKPLESGKLPQYSSDLMLVKNDDGKTYRIVDTSKSKSTSVECEYDKKENRFVYTDADGNKITYKFVEKYFQDNDGVIYAYDETNKTFTGKDGVIYTYNETNKKFKDNYGATYAYDETNKTFTGKDGIIYTYNETNKKFQDNYGMTYDYYETNKTFTGKDGVIYTYDETNKKFKDNDGTTYDYDETNKTFKGKDGVIYTYDERHMITVMVLSQVKMA